MKLKKCVGIFLFSTLCLNVGAIDHKGITFDRLAPDRFTLMENGVANEILVDEQEDAGVMIAVRNLQNDFKRVSGRAAGLCYTPGVKRMIMVGTLKSRYIRDLVKAKKIDASLLEGKNEKYLMTVVSAPLNGVDEALVIVGSDKRGTIYGIYELSEQIGVSPWYDWADVPVINDTVDLIWQSGKDFAGFILNAFHKEWFQGISEGGYSSYRYGNYAYGNSRKSDAQSTEERG